MGRPTFYVILILLVHILVFVNTGGYDQLPRKNQPDKATKFVRYRYPVEQRKPLMNNNGGHRGYGDNGGFGVNGGYATPGSMHGHGGNRGYGGNGGYNGYGDRGWYGRNEGYGDFGGVRGKGYNSRGGRGGDGKNNDTGIVGGDGEVTVKTATTVSSTVSTVPVFVDGITPPIELDAALQMYCLNKTKCNVPKWKEDET